MSAMMIRMGLFDCERFVQRDMIVEVDVVKRGKEITSINVFKRQIEEVTSDTEAVFELDKSIELVEFSARAEATGTIEAGLAVLAQLGIR